MSATDGGASLRAADGRAWWMIGLAAVLTAGVGAVVVRSCATERGPRTVAEAEALVARAHTALALLENQSLDRAVPLLEEIAAALPRDPFAPRNLAIASLLALPVDVPDGERLRAATTQVERVRQLEGDGTAWRWLAALLAVSAGDRAAARERFSEITRDTPTDPAGWYGLWKAEEARAEGRPAATLEPLERAMTLAPANVWLAVTWMRATAARLEAAGPDEPLAEAIEARWAAVAPFAPTIATFARADLRALLDEAAAAARRGEAAIVSGRLRSVANLLAPQSEADRRAVDPHPLEFVQPALASDVLQRFGLDRPPTVPPIPVRFVVGAGPAVPDGESPVAVVLEDLDLDGSLDVVAAFDGAVRAWRLQGGRWEPLFDAAVPPGTVGLLAADLDLDFDEARRPEAAVRPVADGTTAAIRACPAADLDLVVFGARGVTCLENLLAPDGSRSLQAFAFPQPTAEPVRAVVPADLDSDGRLDLVVADAAGVRVLTSLGTAGFRTGDPVVGHDACGDIAGLVCADFDRDVDIDVVIAGTAGCGWLENLRHGQYRFHSVSEAAASAVEVLDADADAAWDIVASGSSGIVRIASRRSPTGVLRTEAPVAVAAEPNVGLMAFDSDNDGALDLATFGAAGLDILRGAPDGAFARGSDAVVVADEAAGVVSEVRDLDAGDLDGDGDLDLVVVTPIAIATLVNDGGNAHHWIDIDLEAQQVKGTGFAPSGRVNAHGLGCLLELRAGASYQPRLVRRRTTHFGLGPRSSADLVRVLWLNGVPQNIIAPPIDVVVCEQQILLGSCPYLYAWNGERHVFVTDLLWGAPLGLQRREGSLMPARPWEHLLVSGDELEPRDGAYVLQVTEELWEAAYFDQVGLTAVDHPADVRVVSNEKVGPAEIASLGVHAVRVPHPPVAARDDLGTDVLAALLAEDSVYPPTAERSRRQGLVATHAIELDAGPAAAAVDRVTLFLTGWTYPTTVGLNLALDRDPSLGVPVPPSLAVPDGNGGWRTVLPFMGFPGGKTKSIAIDLAGLLVPDDPRIRIETSMDIRWDHAFFAIGEEPAEVRMHALPLTSADLHRRGFSRVVRDGTDGPERFDYDQVSHDEKWPPMLGGFTRYGDVHDLVATADDGLVIMAAGDEMTLRFDTGPPCPPGWRRDFLFTSVGWDKDANLATAEGQSVEPLPFRSMRSYPPGPDDLPPEPESARDQITRYHTRTQGDGFWRSPALGARARNE